MGVEIALGVLAAASAASVGASAFGMFQSLDEDPVQAPPDRSDADVQAAAAEFRKREASRRSQESTDLTGSLIGLSPETEPDNQPSSLLGL